ncbi:hypothetical protein CANARDRAFT_29696 [[Candida] arabinofermentans NRRL YB-2248]|uniref:DUF4536 domain-containing protein n=1 Tax=[Candida] arabinofermentans NRRL YB-2248 TaxID=983967 RepID=A0A1E4SW31_9ASCO|nr:hypothetical protein CANARDRAFT_29696 [[Candida] arabinofermentans NRRL YB-2248]
MANSNITDIFNPPQSRELTSAESKECLPCQVLQTITCFAAGAYFSSGAVFSGDANYTKNPNWWRSTVKVGGAGLIGLGIYRGGCGWLWNTDVEYKTIKLL